MPHEFLLHSHRCSGVTVSCDDTQKPARFALILLQPVDPKLSGNGEARTGPDGSFRIDEVAPGDYYAYVRMPGYVETAPDWNDRAMEDMRARYGAALTLIRVSANQMTTAEVVIYRGATISGTVSYDDGSPAAGIRVQPLPAKPAVAKSPTSGIEILDGLQRITSVRTDDQGRYRLAGLEDGTYLIEVETPSTFDTFYGDTIDRRSAKPIKVHLGDESNGDDIEIPLGSMHRISGVVESPEGHLLGRAELQLRLDGGDDDPAINATAAPDGSFDFSAVPDGSFKLLVVNASDDTTHTTYFSNGQAIMVSGGDVSDLVVKAAPRTP